MRYKLQMMDTDFGVGMFAAMPDANLSFNEMTAYLREHPYDDYMHEFVLQGFKNFRTRKLQKLIKEVMKDKGKSDPVMTAVMYEACICHERQRPLLKLFDGLDPMNFIEFTPAIHIRSNALPDQPLHRQWISLFADNIFALSPLPAPDAAGLNQISPKRHSTRPTPRTLHPCARSLKGNCRSQKNASRSWKQANSRLKP